MRTLLMVILLTFSGSGLAVCQILQSHPELCGSPNGPVPLPSGLAMITGTGPEPTLTFHAGGPTVALPGLSEIDEVCPLSDGRLVVFGTMSNGQNFTIIDPEKAMALDEVWAYNPRMSPDRKWVVFRKFYPRYTDLPASDEYLLYDLSKSPVQNGSKGIGIENEKAAIGTAVYPVGWKNEPGDNIGAPPEQQHGHLSSFFWAPDSKAIVFADGNEGKRWVVLVGLDDTGVTTASVSPLAETMECDDPKAVSQGKVAKLTGLRRIEFGPQQGADRLMFIDFEAEGCAPRRALVHSDSFRPAERENRVVERPVKGKVIR